MTAYDPLRQSTDTLVAAVVELLTGEGYSWNRATTSFSAYLATALTGIGGSTVSNRAMSTNQLLAGLVNQLGSGPVSHLTSSRNSLLASLAGADTGGGGGGAPEWVPAGAILVIDTANDHYYADGAVRTQADLFTGSASHYDLTALALAAWDGSEWTTVIQSNDQVALSLNYGDGPSVGTNGFFIAGGPTSAVPDWAFYDYNGPDAPHVLTAGGGVSRLAVAATAGGYSGSADGGVVSSGTMGSPFPSPTPGFIGATDLGTSSVYIAVYPTAAVVGDLPALSALS